MKFNLTLIAAAFGVFFSATQGQRAVIGYPPDGTSVTAGSNLTVEVDRPDTLTGSTEVALVIGVRPCTSSECIPVDQSLGTVLYNGGYDPEFHTDAPFFKPPHQNFTVTIPSTIPKGEATLGVVHVALVGASFSVFLETLNVTLNVV